MIRAPRIPKMRDPSTIEPLLPVVRARAVALAVAITLAAAAAAVKARRPPFETRRKRSENQPPRIIISRVYE